MGLRARELKCDECTSENVGMKKESDISEEFTGFPYCCFPHCCIFPGKRAGMRYYDDISRLYTTWKMGISPHWLHLFPVVGSGVRCCFSCHVLLRGVCLPDDCSGRGCSIGR